MLIKSLKKNADTQKALNSLKTAILVLKFC